MQQLPFSSFIVSGFLQPYGLQPARLLYPWTSPGKNTEVGSHSLLQGIFPTQGSNLGLPHCRQPLYHLSHQGSPKSIHTHFHQHDVVRHFLQVLHVIMLLSLYPSSRSLVSLLICQPSFILMSHLPVELIPFDLSQASLMPSDEYPYFLFFLQ